MMTPELIFDLDSKDMQNLLRTFALSSTQIERAAARAINKTVKWVRTQALRQTAADLGISQKAVKDRFLINLARVNKKKASLWIGLNEISAHKLGKARKTKNGLRIRDREFAGAFQPRKLKPVFRRIGKARLPIEKVMVPIKSSETIIHYLYARAKDQFMKIFERELNFESLKR